MGHAGGLRGSATALDVQADALHRNAGQAKMGCDIHPRPIQYPIANILSAVRR